RARRAPGPDRGVDEGELPAESGPCRGRGRTEVFGWLDEAPVVFGPTIDEASPVTEANQVQRPDVHDRLEPVELFVGRLHVLAVPVAGRGDTVLVGPTRAPTASAPHEPRQVGEARSAPRSHPVDRHWPAVAYDRVTLGMQEIAVDQTLRQAVPVVG